MLIGRDKVVEYVRLNKSPLWDIRKTDGAAIIVPGPQEDGVNLEESLERLETALELLGPGVYHITCKPSKNTNSKHLLKSNFKVPLEEGLPGHRQQPAIGMLSEEEVERRVQEKLRAAEQERELKELREQMQELDNGMNRFLTRLEPYLPAIIEGITGSPIVRSAKTPKMGEAQVAGIDSDDEAQVRLEKAFAKWYELEKEVDPVELVEKIVDLAENNPGMYKTAKQMLMK